MIGLVIKLSLISNDNSVRKFKRTWEVLVAVRTWNVGGGPNRMGFRPCGCVKKSYINIKLVWEKSNLKGKMEEIGPLVVCSQSLLKYLKVAVVVRPAMKIGWNCKKYLEREEKKRSDSLLPAKLETAFCLAISAALLTNPIKVDCFYASVVFLPDAEGHSRPVSNNSTKEKRNELTPCGEHQTSITDGLAFVVFSSRES